MLHLFTYIYRLYTLNTYCLNSKATVIKVLGFLKYRFHFSIWLFINNERSKIEIERKTKKIFL